MEKDAFYFPHFCNARHDRKIKRLRKELGVEGYGIFFMLLEVLRDQIDFKYPIQDIDLLAEEFGTSEQKVRVVICNYQLFEVDEKEQFFSPKLLLYLQPYLRMKEQRKLAGKISGEARRLKAEQKKLLNGCSTDVQDSFNECSTTDERTLNENEQSKVKKSKVNKNIYYDVVKLYDEEHQKLIERFGESGTNSRLENLSLYIQSKGDKYKSHYATILSWEKKNEKKETSTEFKNPYRMVD